MVDTVGGDFVGVEDIIRKLNGLEDDVRFKGGRFAGRKAANIIREAAIGNALRFDRESSREKVADNVVVRFAPKQFKATGDIKFRVGVMGGARTKRENEKNPGGDTFYWRFLEFGTERIQAKPFLRDAAERKSGAAYTEFAEQFNKAIDRAIRRLK